MADRGYLHRLRTSGGLSHDLLVLLDQHRVMTTDQLARATGTGTRNSDAAPAAVTVAAWTRARRARRTFPVRTR